MKQVNMDSYVAADLKILEKLAWKQQDNESSTILDGTSPRRLKVIVNHQKTMILDNRIQWDQYRKKYQNTATAVKRWLEFQRYHGQKSMRAVSKSFNHKVQVWRTQEKEQEPLTLWGLSLNIQHCSRDMRFPIWKF